MVKIFIKKMSKAVATIRAGAAAGLKMVFLRNFSLERAGSTTSFQGFQGSITPGNEKKHPCIWQPTQSYKILTSFSIHP